MSDIVKLPTLQELIEGTKESIKDKTLRVLLNAEPPADWTRDHPIVTVKNKQNQSVPLKYLPIERVEYLLTRIFGHWWVEVKSVTPVANSVVVVVTLFVKNPLTGEIEHNDGVGANVIQTDAGAGADWTKVKAAGVQIAAPAAETYAIKDAAEKWGKIFGKDLGRKDVIAYDNLIKPALTWEYLSEQFEEKKDKLNETDRKEAQKILDERIEKSYVKLNNLLNKQQ